MHSEDMYGPRTLTSAPLPSAILHSEILGFDLFDVTAPGIVITHTVLGPWTGISPGEGGAHPGKRGPLLPTAVETATQLGAAVTTLGIGAFWGL